MAWIGWHAPESGLLVPVAHAGDDHGYLDEVTVSAREEPHGRGPSGEALREGRPFVCNDSLNDPSMLPWRDALARAGLRASAAVPIHEAGVVRGVLNVYASRPNYFQKRELQLLERAASELSMGIDNLVRDEERRRAEAARDLERRFATHVIEAMPGVFYLYNRQGEFLRWNRNFERVTGYSADEIRAMRPTDFFVGDDKHRVSERIEETFEHGEARIEASLCSKDGTLTPHVFTGTRIVLDDVTCLVGVGIDISKRTRAEEALRRSEERYRSTLESILEGAQLIGFDWQYLYLNEAAAGQNRRPNAELLGKRMQDMWPGIEATPVFALLEQCMLERRPRRGEIEFIFGNGERAWFDVRVQPVPEGIFALSIDVTERRRAEDRLRELNEMLEQRVAERTRDLEAARLQAESADRIKSAFLATMSHELRTPLNSIIGFTGILAQQLAGPLNEEQVKQLGMVRQSARHLLDLINDVLDISKIEAGELEIHRAATDVRQIVVRVLDTLRPAARKKELELTLVAPDNILPVQTDARRVQQILLNLVNNAIKFTDRGAVSVELHIEDAHIRIDVIDSGIGISEKDIPKLFQAFRQVHDGLVRPYDGTGLGLAICRRLVGLLRGEICVESTVGKGSTFTVRLPLDDAS
ncbi:MAG: ATP-binding protein [Kofleriaceae bacterium]